jgi:hypothetical protein
MSVEDIAKANIEHFKQLLETETDPQKRAASWSGYWPRKN